MANGMLGSLPPGLRGYVAGEQMQQQRGMNQLQQAGGLLGLQGQQQQQAIQQHGLLEKQQQMKRIQDFASTLPPPEQQKFMLNPGEYLKELNKKYVVGGALVGGGGGKPVYEAPPDPNQPFARGAAGQPPVPNLPFQKFKLDQAAAGAGRQITNVNAFTPASETAQAEFMKGSRATYDQLKQAPVALESIEKAKALVPSAKGFMGTGGEPLLEAAKFLNNRAGMNINTEGVKSAEELRTRIFFNIMDNLKKMDASPSQMQQQIMMESLGKLGTDPNALPAVLDAFADVIKGKVVLHNKEVAGAIQRGVKFPYDPLIELRKSPAPQAGGDKPIKRTGTLNGKKVVEYADGTIEYSQ